MQQIHAFVVFVYLGKDLTDGIDKYDFGLMIPPSEFSKKIVSCVPLLSESKIWSFIGTVLLIAALGRGGRFGGVRCCSFRPIKGEISRLLPLEYKKLINNCLFVKKLKTERI